MYTVEVEYFVRLVLLLTRVALPALRDYVNKNHKKKSVHDFLRGKRDQIEGLKDTLPRFQWYQLKDGTVMEVDISKWDISVLSCIPLHLFGDLAQPHKKAIEFITSVKNNIQSHTPSGRITRKVVEQKYKEITREINILCSGQEFSQQERLDLQERFRSVDEDELDISKIITELRSNFSNEDFVGRVVHIFENFMRNIDGKLTAVYSNQASKHISENDDIDMSQAINDGFCDLKEDLKSYASNGNNNIVTVIVAGIRLESSNPNTVEKTAAMIAEETNTVVSGSPETSIQSELNENVKNLIALLEATGAVVKGARLGCVLIEIECPTVQTVIDVWECFESQAMQHHLNQIALLLFNEINDDIQISAFIPLDSIERVLRDVEQNAVYHAEVEIVMQCHNKDEALHILDIFRGGSADEEVKRIAKHLSDEVGAAISLDTFLDRIHHNNPEILSDSQNILGNEVSNSESNLLQKKQYDAEIQMGPQHASDMQKKLPVEQKQSLKELPPTDSCHYNVDDICEMNSTRQKHQTKEGSRSVPVDDLPRQKKSHSFDPKTDPSNPDKLTTLWVGNVTEDIAEELYLLRTFACYGHVKSIRCLPHKFCAFINYKDPDAAVRAMKSLQGVRLGRNPLIIRFPDKPIDNSKQWGFANIRTRDEHYIQSRHKHTDHESKPKWRGAEKEYSYGRSTKTFE